MLIALIILSVLNLLQFVLLIGCVIKITDLNTSLDYTIEHLRQVEESRCRMQTLVHNKFNYHVPVSDKYLSLEELKFEKNIGGTNETV